MKIVYLLIGCLILGIGVYMEVLADVVMLPGESFVRAIVLTGKSTLVRQRFSLMCLWQLSRQFCLWALPDTSMVFEKAQSIAALLVGFIARVLGKKLAVVKPDI